ncbi:hypothetical protein GCM10010417_41070 [Streptomyces carpaticus]
MRGRGGARGGGADGIGGLSSGGGVADASGPGRSAGAAAGGCGGRGGVGGVAGRCCPGWVLIPFPPSRPTLFRRCSSRWWSLYVYRFIQWYRAPEEGAYQPPAA